MRVDKQFALAVILILLGFGLVHVGGGQGGDGQGGDGQGEPFLAGLGFGLIVMASVWIAIRIIREYRGR